MASTSEALPEDTVFHYLAEGAANSVYRISIPPRTSTPEPSVVEEYGDGTPPPSIIEDNLSPLWDIISQGKFNILFPYSLQMETHFTSWILIFQPREHSSSTSLLCKMHG
jgi:hypothetical protein